MSDPSLYILVAHDDITKTMTEREGPIDDYWTEDFPLGEGRFYRQPHAVRLAFHQSEERYSNRREFFPLDAPQGSRMYFHAKPYLSLPDIRINVRLYDQPREGAIGETEAIFVEGVRKEFVGNAQGWYYPKEKALMLWECYLEDRHRITNPLDDENLDVIWRGFERTLLERTVGAEKLYTTWEDIYARPVWQRFLEHQGYQQVDKALFEKGVGRS